MFDVKCKAEVKNLNVRTEIHGDDNVPAYDVTLMLLGVPVDCITRACPDIGKRFYSGDQVAIGEVNPLTVQHKMENLTVKIGERTLNGCDIKKGAKIMLLPEKVANVEVKVQVEHRGDIVLDIMAVLRDEVIVSINERQLEIVGMEQ